MQRASLVEAAPKALEVFLVQGGPQETFADPPDSKKTRALANPSRHEETQDARARNRACKRACEQELVSHAQACTLQDENLGT